MDDDGLDMEAASIREEPNEGFIRIGEHLDFISAVHEDGFEEMKVCGFVSDIKRAFTTMSNTNFIGFFRHLVNSE
jgi:hypothetical protein